MAAFWSDVGFVKLMSNHHTPTSGHVLRRVSGKVEREERCAPTVGVEYNDKMGGTDLKDFMRGVYTTQRVSKKWWKTLYHWVIDGAMYNTFCLHRHCYQVLKPKKKYKMQYVQFIRQVAESFIVKPAHHESTPTPRKYSKNKRSVHGKILFNCSSLHHFLLVKNSGMLVVLPTLLLLIVPAPIWKRTPRKTRGTAAKNSCKYCYNAFDAPVFKLTMYR